MRRLSSRSTRRQVRTTPRWQRRLGDERGAVAVWVALMIIPLLGCAALAVDVSSAYADRAQLDNAADAAALAVTLDCARNACGNTVSTATSVVLANTTSAAAADATIGSTSVAVSGRTVTVTARATSDHYFAQAIGQPSDALAQRSSASWAPVTEGVAQFPLTLSWCEYRDRVARYPLGSRVVQRLDLATELGSNSCRLPDGSTTRSGYALTAPDSGGSCSTSSSVRGTEGWYFDWFLARLPAGCSNSYLSTLVGTDILIPVWDQVTSANTLAMRFRVYGYSAFRVTGFENSYLGGPGLLGYFTWSVQQADSTTVPTGSAPDLGARSVYLTDQG